jgi:hypothetical protein
LSSILLAAVSCSEDLPVQPAPDDTEMSEQAQTGDKAGRGGTSGAGGKSSMTAGRPGGASGSTSGEAGSGASKRMTDSDSDNTESGGEGGSGGKASNESGGSGGASGSGGSAGSSPAKPAVKVVPACMGRAGEMVCDGAKMIKCGEMFDAAETQPCQNEARCRAGLEAGKCGACDPGVVECMEADLYECSMAGEMVMTEHCDSPALCDEIGKKCDPAACQMDEHKCEGGDLLRCSDDLTEFESKMPCPMELCDATGKKCNVCLPASKICVGDTLEVCSADGSGKQEMKCPVDKPLCEVDKCVQCKDTTDCEVSNSCQTASCNAGMCMVQNKPVGADCSDNGGKKCSLLGECVACNTDLDCSSSQRCSPVFGCIERAALTVIPSFFPGNYTVQVNAGYGMKISQVKSTDPLLAVEWTGNGKVGVTAVEGATVLEKFNMTRTVTFTGPMGQGMLGSLAVNCTGTATLDGTGATLQFAVKGTDTMPGDCMAQIIGLTATQ